MDRNSGCNETQGHEVSLSLKVSGCAGFSQFAKQYSEKNKTMRHQFSGFCLVVLILMIGFTAGKAEAGSPFAVTDSDFVDGVYDFHYYTYSNTFSVPLAKRTVINGVDQGTSDPTLTNSGWAFGDPFSGLIGFWAAAGPFGATNTAGELTMGWDFSAITGQIASVELKTRHFLFKFDPWNTHALGDEIAGFVATPNVFGSGIFSQLYSFVGDNTTATIGSGAIEDITSFLPGGWLMTPDLLELKFTYAQTPSPTIPGRHLQIFRDNTGVGDDGFLLRVTLVEVTDSDGDGVPDEEDICPGFDDNIDSDGDTVPDGCDACPFDADNDADMDGFCADVDVCPGGDDNQNMDGDTLPDFCDGCPLDPENDADGDGLCESDDNCPTVFNDDQTDTDGDLEGDACDLDDDDDGVDDDSDNCPLTVNSDQANFDGDSIGDVCDPDDDNDGVDDVNDAFPFDPTESVDTDGDGVGDNADPCPTDANDLCVFPNQGQCISSRIAQECSGLTGQARAACNKEQQQLCKAAF